MLDAQAAAGTGFEDQMLFALTALDCTKLAIAGTFIASGALLGIDISNLALFTLGIHRTGRADIRTGHAANALAVINNRNMIYHGDGSKLAGLGTGSTGNADILALLFRLDAKHWIAAADGNHTLRRTHAQHMLWAGRDTASAALALFLIHYGNLLDGVDMNRIKGTSPLTGSETETGIGAFLDSAVDHQCGHAIMNSLILSFCFAAVCKALTGNNRNFSSRVSSCFHSHDFCHLRRNLRAADCTQTNFGFACCHRCRIAITARISAGATVRAREAFPKSIYLGIRFDFENLIGYAEECTKAESENAHDANSF